MAPDFDGTVHIEISTFLSEAKRPEEPAGCQSRLPHATGAVVQDLADIDGRPVLLLHAWQAGIWGCDLVSKTAYPANQGFKNMHELDR